MKSIKRWWRRLWCKLFLTGGPVPGPMKVIYTTREKILEYNQLFNRVDDGWWSFYYMGAAYIDKDLSPEQREEAIAHAYQYHCGYIK